MRIYQVWFHVEELEEIPMDSMVDWPGQFVMVEWGPDE